MYFLERDSILSITSKYKETKDVITIHTEMLTCDAWSEINANNRNETLQSKGRRI